MDSEQNYKKSGRLSFAKENLEQFEETLISLNNQFINRDDNTKLKITKKSNGNTKILLTYDEYKPSLIDLLDKSTRQVEITLNTHSDTCSLDFDLQAPNDYKKVKELITYLTSTTGEIQFDFEEISLNKLTKLQRIELFDKFFKSIKKPWSLVEIKKLKVKRETTEEENVLGDTLQGINSAVLDGDNLRENQFVKSTLSTGFYFSMASMRLNHSSKPHFIDLVIDFKTRPEMCEVKIINSGIYVDRADGSAVIKEVKSVMDNLEQDSLLLEYKNNLYDIFKDLENSKLPNIDIFSTKEVAAADEGNKIEPSRTETGEV